MWTHVVVNGSCPVPEAAGANNNSGQTLENCEYRSYKNH